MRDPIKQVRDALAKRRAARYTLIKHPEDVKGFLPYLLWVIGVLWQDEPMVLICGIGAIIAFCVEFIP
jgi:hypothetical protein